MGLMFSLLENVCIKEPLPLSDKKNSKRMKMFWKVDRQRFKFMGSCWKKKFPNALVYFWFKSGKNASLYFRNVIQIHGKISNIIPDSDLVLNLKTVGWPMSHRVNVECNSSFGLGLTSKTFGPLTLPHNMTFTLA